MERRRRHPRRLGLAAAGCSAAAVAECSAVVAALPAPVGRREAPQRARLAAEDSVRRRSSAWGRQAWAGSAAAAGLAKRRRSELALRHLSALVSAPAPAQEGPCLVRQLRRVLERLAAAPVPPPLVPPALALLPRSQAGLGPWQLAAVRLVGPHSVLAPPREGASRLWPTTAEASAPRRLAGLGLGLQQEEEGLVTQRLVAGEGSGFLEVARQAPHLVRLRRTQPSPRCAARKWPRDKKTVERTKGFVCVKRDDV